MISLKNLTDQERHDYILKTYVLNKSQSNESRKHKRDIDVIKENHRFLWDSDEAETESWEKRLARKYYDKLFKEYCIADLTRFKENKIALRWRIESEVIAGKGQFQCGNRKCEERDFLKTWEVNFAYNEDGERKNALVKLRLCPEHSIQLNYRSKKREVKRLKHAEKKQKREAKRHGRKSKHKQAQEDSSEDEMLPETGTDVETEVAPETVKNIEKDNAAIFAANDILNADESIWSKKLEIDSEPITREMEFERYLEDLFF